MTRAEMVGVARDLVHILEKEVPVDREIDAKGYLRCGKCKSRIYPGNRYCSWCGQRINEVKK